MNVLNTATEGSITCVIVALITRMLYVDMSGPLTHHISLGNFYGSSVILVDGDGESGAGPYAG